VGGSDHGLLPHPELLQLVITVTLGALLGSLGAYTRMRIESRRPAGESP